MNKTIGVLILTLGWLVSFSQTGKPCAGLDQNRDISGMREILMRDGLFYQNLRASYAEAINHSIGKNVVTSSKYGMEDILKNTILVDADFVVPSDYFNGVRYGDVVRFTTLTGQPSKKWAAYRYMGVDYIYAKVSCMNAEKIKKPLVYKEPEPIPIPAPHETRRDNSLPTDYGGQKKLLAEATTFQQQSVDLNLPKPQKKFFQKKGVKIGAFVVGTGGVAGILYAVLHKSATIPPHGTMSGGRPFEETQTTTGSASTDSGGSTGGRGN